MATYFTPGSYIEEISKLPASVAPVATAIPAFIGYTQLDGVNNILHNVPTRITSMLEYKEKFGGAVSEAFEVTLTDSDISVALNGGATSPFILPYQLEMYFANGGGPCYIVSVEIYANTGSISVSELETGLDACQQEDEITLLCVPEAIALGSSDRLTLNDKMLTQCALLKDRFAIMDVFTDLNDTIFNDGGKFRNNDVSADNLKYGGAYYPALKTSIEYNFDEDVVKIFDNRKMGIYTHSSGINEPLSSLLTGVQFSGGQNLGTQAEYFIDITSLADTDKIVVNGQEYTYKSTGTLGTNEFKLASELENLITPTLAGYNLSSDDTNKTLTISAGTSIPESLGNNIKISHNGSGNASISLGLCKIAFNNLGEGDIFSINGNDFTFKDPAPATVPVNQFVDGATLVIGLDSYFSTNNLPFNVSFDGSDVIIRSISLESSFTDLNLESFITSSNGEIEFTIQGIGIDGINKTLYNQIKKELSKQKLTLYPCGAIAGVYASVDRTRGVWKAPANISLNRVIAPAKLVTHDDQESLNIDTTSGKSINAIRNFFGKGNLVWGARTLAGNDNEWRYVNVRRLFIFMEESIQKATEFVVFEPNDANTWNRVKGMIENFLTKLWREGALAGAKPEEAFFVNVGLGVTMTSDEILNGIMNVEIGVAAVRPAEFIVLKFSHKLQVS